ncbi:MAG TPA: enoyl-CoA hydratase/isomerase family protein [Mycobacteriales bacterium]|jgi:enoyl-CoA hydratase/carnithine racemase|nr:enoyl-CoA hydratase/isomerase family protein [Mycobacteriales bacterium]
MVRMEPVDAESDWMLRLDVADGIATLTLDHPDKLNAWSWEATRQLGKRADQIRFDDSVRVVVLRAEGRAFCAGIDLGMPEDRITGRSQAEKARNFYEGLRWVHERFHAFSDLPQPIIAAVHGYCLGFGFELALMADIRIASDDAIFALPEAQVGVSIDAGGDLRLARDAGAGWAKLLALTGRRIDAATAERIGVVQSVVSRDELDEAAMTIAREIRDNAPLAVQSIKRTINAFADNGLSEAMRFESMSASVAFVSEDMPKGYAAKAKKQTPEFEGK